MSHGGKRKGAGRKPAPKGERKVERSIKLAPKLDEYLRQRENATATIETALRRSKDFRDWKKAQGKPA